MNGILLSDGNEIFAPLRIGEAKNQIAEFALKAYRGDIKAAPEIGAWLDGEIGATSDAFLFGRIKKNLKSAGLEVEKLELNNNILNIKIK